MTFQVVFNLYPFSENLYLPSANIVQTDASGQLAHIMQKALPATIVPYSIPLTPQLERLFELIESLTPKSLETRFKAPKARTAAPLAQLLSDPATKGAVETYLYRQLDQFLSEIARHRLPLTLDAERRTLAKDVLVVFGKEELVPHLAFHKTAAGVAYRLQLGTEEDKWSIRERNVVPLTNTEPAWLLADYALFRVPGINGNMVKPFRQKDVIQIPPDKVRVYFKQFIAKNAGRTRIEAEGFAVQSSERLRAARLDPTENILEKNWFLSPVFEYEGVEFPYGDRREQRTSVDFSDETGEIAVRQVRRNAGAEAALVNTLLSLGLRADGRMFTLPEQAGAEPLQQLLEWLSEHRPALEKQGFILTPPQVEGRSISLLQAELHVRSEAAGDWFDVHGTLTVGPHSFPFKALLGHLKRHDPYFLLPDGTYFLIPEEWFARYAELARTVQEGPEGLRVPKALFTVLQEAEPDNEDFPLIDPDQIDYTPSPDLKATLRPYQLRGVKWLVGHYRHGFGACLADDMGLGKTLQTIALLLHIKSAAAPTAEVETGGAQLDLFQSYQAEIKPLRALIILPASLVFNWQQELWRFAPGLFVYAHTGPKRLKDARALAGHDVVLSTYHTARADLDLLGRVAWQVIVLDESQQIKNRESEVSKVVRALQGGYKISLSGTPIENSLADLWTQMEFINPATLGSFPSFREQFILPIEKRNDAEAKQRLFRRVRPFFMRRTKDEVAPDLPALSEQVFLTEMAPEQRKRYEQIKSAVRNEILSLFDDPKTRLMALQALTRLRQLANHPRLTEPDYAGDSGKFGDVLAQWDTVRRAGHKVLFFSSFEKHLQLFKRVFDQEGYAYAWLTGDTPTPERAREVARFQEDPRVQAFFMTVKAGGVGLNLTAADYVFLLDPWWNPAVEDQAIARAHRIGQTRPVTALRFIARDTIEEKIRVLQERKKQLGQGLFGDGTADMPTLSREDLEGLLG